MSNGRRRRAKKAATHPVVRATQRAVAQQKVQVVAPGTTPHDPSTKQRSDYRLDVESTQRLAEIAARGISQSGRDILEPDICAWTRNVHDGRLDVYVGTIPGQGIHLSIAHKRFSRGGWRPGRYPTWDEIMHARTQLLPPDRAFKMVLPKEEEYLALHPTTFHLHEETPRGVVEWPDGSMWNVEIAQLPDGNLEVDGDGYPVGRLTPFAVPMRSVSPSEAGEGDVTATPDATGATQASSGPPS